MCGKSLAGIPIPRSSTITCTSAWEFSCTVRARTSNHCFSPAYFMALLIRFSRQEFTASGSATTGGKSSAIFFSTTNPASRSIGSDVARLCATTGPTAMGRSVNSELPNLSEAKSSTWSSKPFQPPALVAKDLHVLLNLSRVIHDSIREVFHRGIDDC